MYHLLLCCAASLLFFSTPAKQMFSGLKSNQSVCPSVCMSAYKILVILCREIPLQFCFKCIKTLHIHWSHIEVLQGAILNLDFFIACFCQSAGRGSKSHSVTVLDLKLRRWRSLVSVVWEASPLHGKILSIDRHCAFVEKRESLLIGPEVFI